MTVKERRQRYYQSHREELNKKTLQWREKNQEKYKEHKDLRNKKRYPKQHFLNSIGFDHKKDTVRKNGENWLILSKDKQYTILPCQCKAEDCQGYALVENDETMINLHNNLMKLSHILGPSSQCITKRLD